MKAVKESKTTAAFLMRNADAIAKFGKHEHLTFIDTKQDFLLKLANGDEYI